MNNNKNSIKDIDRTLYDFKDDESRGDFFREKEGITEEIVRHISEEKEEPQWMLDFRLKCLKIYKETPMPVWGPDISELDMDQIASYVRHKSEMKNNWEDVPEDNSTIENWSKNMFNLNTKRVVVDEGGKMEWVSGSFGSHVSYLYPMTILKGEGAQMTYTGITFSGEGQNLDTGAKVVHLAPRTTSVITSKSISKSGGIGTFRSSVVIAKQAKESKCSVSCDSLMLDSISRADTVPAMDIRAHDADVGHEAKIGRISDEAVFYLMSRGMTEEDAKALIVSGFADSVSKELPLEYAVEMNNLIKLEMSGHKT